MTHLMHCECMRKGTDTSITWVMAHQCLFAARGEPRHRDPLWVHVQTAQLGNENVATDGGKPQLHGGARPVVRVECRSDLVQVQQLRRRCRFLHGLSCRWHGCCVTAGRPRPRRPSSSNTRARAMTGRTNGRVSADYREGSRGSSRTHRGPEGNLIPTGLTWLIPSRRSESHSRGVPVLGSRAFRPRASRHHLRRKWHTDRQESASEAQPARNSGA
jgi:hypothetical protein